MSDFVDVIERLPNSDKPREAGRTRLQAVMLAEMTWLQPFLIPTDVYICPSEVMAHA